MTEEKKQTFKAPPLPKGIQMPAPKSNSMTSEASVTPPTMGHSIPPAAHETAVHEGVSTPLPTARSGATPLPTAQPAKSGTVYPPQAYLEHNFAQEMNLPPKILEKKVVGSILAAIFFFGIMMGCSMFGGSGNQVVQGLTDVVINQDIRYRLPRCGQTNPNNECVLYIMNAKTFDRLGSDFFQEAQNITGIPQYTIRLSNVQYANALIRPGYIAQIYIPARK